MQIYFHSKQKWLLFCVKPGGIAPVSAPVRDTEARRVTELKKGLMPHALTGYLLPRCTNPARMHRQVEGRLKSITLTGSVTGKHYASLLYETEQAAPEPLRSVDAAKVV